MARENQKLNQKTLDIPNSKSYIIDVLNKGKEMYLRANDFTSHGKVMVWEPLLERGHEYDSDIEVEVTGSVADIEVEKDDILDEELWETLTGSRNTERVSIKRVGVVA